MFTNSMDVEIKKYAGNNRSLELSGTISTWAPMSSHETILNLAQNIKILSMIVVPVLN